jgi:hypothetical protein
MVKYLSQTKYKSDEIMMKFKETSQNPEKTLKLIKEYLKEDKIKRIQNDIFDVKSKSELFESYLRPLE